ncbi:MAG: hypothetical protein V1905_00275 [bacterium]
MSKDRKRPGFSGMNTLLIMVTTAVAIVCVVPLTISPSLADSIFAIENPSDNNDKSLSSIKNSADLNGKLIIMEDNSLLTTANFVKVDTEPIERFNVVVTGYSSTIEETDDTPFITAANTAVRQGIVAANFLSFGTKIRIPEVYGDMVFVVEDRMNVRNRRNVDIWFPSHPEAKEFGVKRTYIEVLKN